MCVVGEAEGLRPAQVLPLGLSVGLLCSLMGTEPCGLTCPPSSTAGTRARYVDVLNPGGPRRAEPALAPADFFAPLAPLPIPAHLCGPDPGRRRGSSRVS